jgi:hypothetical protein
MKVSPGCPAAFMNTRTVSPSAAKYESTTDAIRYSGAISERITSASSTVMTAIAIGMTVCRSPSESWATSLVNAACPVTPEAEAPAIRPARAVAARTAGIAWAAAVVVAPPADSEVANEIVRPSALTYELLARYDSNAARRAAGTRAEAGIARGGP